MRKAIKFKKKKDIMGQWTYNREELGEVEVKKGKNTFKASELFNGLDCVKLDKLIYDIEKYEDGVVTLTEPVIEGFKGMAYYEETIPLKIMGDADVLDIMIDSEEVFIDKSALKLIPYNKADKDLKMRYLKELQDNGKNNVSAESTTFMVIDTNADQKIQSKQMFVKQLLEIVVHIDMDYEVEEGKNLWDELGLKSKDYVGLATKMKELGILMNLDDVETLRFTIEAIKIGEKDVEDFVMKTKLRSAELRREILANQMIKG